MTTDVERIVTTCSSKQILFINFVTKGLKHLFAHSKESSLLKLANNLYCFQHMKVMNEELFEQIEKTINTLATIESGGKKSIQWFRDQINDLLNETKVECSLYGYY